MPEGLAIVQDKRGTEPKTSQERDGRRSKDCSNPIEALVGMALIVFHPRNRGLL